MILRRYTPKEQKKHANYESCLIRSRENYYKNKPKNLTFLFKKRYDWVNKYIKKGDKVLELGCGIGVSKELITKDCNLLLTDYVDSKWIDKKVNALDTKLPKNSFDIIYCSNTLHHLDYPKKFFIEMNRILKPNGLLLIQEVNCSLMLKIILKILKIEGWSFDADVYNLKKPCCDKNIDTANNATPNLLFDNTEKFHKNIPYFRIEEQEYSEFMIYPLSGGIIPRKKTINIPYFILEIIDKLDNLLVKTFPKIFALQRRVVLRKIKEQ